MNLVLIGGAALVGALVLFQIFRKANLRKLVRYLRWLVGGLLAAATGFLLLRGQVGIASLTGYVAFMILRYGRIGPWTFESTTLGADNRSTVKSRFISMKLDHDTGTIEGRVVAGPFRGRDLLDLGEDEMRRLLEAVASDTDSLALLETWLDRNRAGWREHFGQPAGEGAGSSAGAGEPTPGIDPVREAYEVLGLQPGASVEEIHDAHRKLMKGVHPDQGGSTYLAARINAAKDLLLKKAGG